MVFMASLLQNSGAELILTFSLVKGQKVPDFRIDHEKMNRPKLDRIFKIIFSIWLHVFCLAAACFNPRHKEKQKNNLSVLILWIW